MSNLEPRPQITKVWAKNFRSIEFAELELGPLTVLVGPNASGKSNLLDVLRFVSDALSDGLDAAITDRGGINSIRRKSARGKAYDTEIGLSLDDDESIIEYEFAIASRASGEYQVKREYIRLEFKAQPEASIEVEIRNGYLIKPKLKRRENNPENSPRWMLEGYKFDQRDLVLPSVYQSERGFVVVAILMETRGESPLPIFFGKGLSMLNDRLSYMEFYHIFPNELRDPQKVSDPYPLKERGENLASVLRDMIQRKSPYLQELKGALGHVVPGVSDIKVTPAASFLVVQLNHEGAQNNGRDMWLDLSLESDGTLRLLGMLVALLQDPPPSLIAIEEPELTIHPGALAVLADIMNEAALRTQVLITTHSPDLIDRLPIESIRAVTAEGGLTNVGMVADHQIRSVKEGLFLPGELHRMEGLQVAGKEG